LAGVASLGGIIWFVLRRAQGRGTEDGDMTEHDIYFLKPELDDTSGGRGGGAVANINELPRQELDGLQGVRPELPPGGEYENVSLQPSAIISLINITKVPKE